MTAPSQHNWRDRARCRTSDPELFFTDSTVEVAQAICARCPVQALCAQWAGERRIPYGVWGGQLRTRRSNRPTSVVQGDWDDEILTAVDRLTAHRFSASEIAYALKITERTVTRYRARLRELEQAA